MGELSVVPVSSPKAMPGGDIADLVLLVSVGNFTNIPAFRRYILLAYLVLEETELLKECL